jgi:hypothetical protein
MLSILIVFNLKTRQCLLRCTYPTTLIFRCEAVQSNLLYSISFIQAAQLIDDEN